MERLLEIMTLETTEIENPHLRRIIKKIRDEEKNKNLNQNEEYTDWNAYSDWSAYYDIAV